MVAPHTAPSYQQPPGNGLAVAGMVLGIIGLVLCWIPIVGGLCAIVGIILGALGMGRAKKIGGKGKGLALAGLVCGIVGVVLGIAFFVMMMRTVSAFDDYVTRAKRSEASLQMRSIEQKVKLYRNERGKLPASAPEMPGKISSVCGNPGMKFPRTPQSQWTAGWAEMDFQIDEDSRCSYEFVSTGQTATIISRCDLDCDTTASETRVELSIVEGNVQAVYGEPTPD